VVEGWCLACEIMGHIKILCLVSMRIRYGDKNAMQFENEDEDKKMSWSKITSFRAQELFQSFVGNRRETLRLCMEKFLKNF